MKNGLLKNVFLCVMIVFMGVFCTDILKEFAINHTYYSTMFSDMKYWRSVIVILISSLIPTFYILFKNKRFSVPIFAIFLFIGIFIFGVVNLGLKNSLIFPTGVIPYFVNELLLFAFGGLFLVGTLAFGTWISNLIFKFKENRIQEMFLKFGIGLGTLLILWQTLIGFGLFYPVVSRIIFLGLCFMIWYEKDELTSYNNILGDIFDSFSKGGNNNRWKYILLVLIVFSLVYYFYGFQLSFIPYSTAWDANHEYMYVPKVISGNHGLIRGNMGIANHVPFLWYSFISFWFSIGSVFGGDWLAPDTIAVSMNFLSGPLCLIFGLLLIKEVLDFFIPKKDGDNDAVRGIGFATGWATLLLWLCSGMGAFLVFIDNKTDLGVMAITILAALSGFIFIRYIAEHKGKGIIDKESVKYLVVSGIFFALACMSKPTAFIDVAVFGVLLCALWLNSFVGLGVGIMGLGFMGILKPLTAAEMMTESLGKWLILIGLIIAIFGIVMMFVRQDQEKTREKSLFSYLVIWGVAFVCTLVVFKGPWLAYYQINLNSFSLGNRGKGLLLSSNINDNDGLRNNNKILLATTEEYLDLENQNKIDSDYLDSLVEGDVVDIDRLPSELESQSSSDLTLSQCKSIKYSDDELTEGMQSAPVTNEDLGRYVGYGRKVFSNKKRVSYRLLRLFYHKDGKCYGVNSDAKILCENQFSILNGDINTIKSLQLKEGSPAYEIWKSGIESYNEDPDTLTDFVLNLKTYYQNHIIYTDTGSLYIPYRYVTPLNIVFNRSLQNISSYYTDIGFIWMFIFVFLIFSFVYSIIKKDRKLFAVSMATVVGRAIWRVIGSAILWYGVGLLIWTTLVMAMYIMDLLSGKNRGSDIPGAIALIIFGVFIITQFFYNFIRIASQGSVGPFLWYKQSVGTEEILDQNLNVSENIKIGYSQKDVFDLQFPQYNQFIEYVKDRADEDGVLVAGTYIQYFLDNQRNILLDGDLSRFWEQGSDGDICKMYQRLKNKNIKYLVIDPNIASIVMGEGNQSLFYRFFAKTNNKGKIVEKGALMMLSELIDQGYAKLLYSNNLGAIYGFTLSDDELLSEFGSMDKDMLIFLRAQLSAAKFMSNVENLVDGIANIFYYRISNGLVAQDIADVYGKKIELSNVIDAMNAYIVNPRNASEKISSLTQDERIVLYQYIYLYKLAQNPYSSQYKNHLNNIFSTSIGGGSQLIVVELL